MNFALFGFPVAHSVSPAMHNAALANAGLQGRYHAVRVAPDELGSAIARLRAGEWQGANVTIPHKEAVLDHLDALTASAVNFGAVNTIFSAGDSLIGDNTDIDGFLEDLQAHGVSVSGQRVMVFGYGGSARAIVFGLVQAGAAEIRILGRKVEKAAALAEELRSKTGARLSGHALSPLNVGDFAPETGLAVNCTPLGMAPDLYSSPWPQVVPIPETTFVYDLVYNPARTTLLRQAQAHKARAASGLGMLVNQGALAFTRWTGLSPNRRVMRRAAEHALQEISA